MKKVINAIGLDQETKTKDTPASDKPLLKDEEGPPRKENWNYSMVIGMLLYLNNTRPEISFVVSQCARYLSCDKLSHEQAVKRIVKYLIGTNNKGLLICPPKHLYLDHYVDANFAGQWTLKTSQDSISVKS